MLFAIICTDKPASLDLRQATRPRHLDYWKSHAAHVIQAGPLLDAVAACNRSRALPSLILPLRAGVAGGPVIVFEGDDYVGRPVNLAAKLCALADPSKALVHQALAERLPASLTVLATTRRSVPGFAEPIDLLEVALPSTAPLGAGQLDA
jgi:class 3 adenylate cyclase